MITQPPPRENYILHVAPASQYSYQAPSACTPIAIEAALLLLAGHDPDTHLVIKALKVGQAYKGHYHLDLEEVVQGVERYNTTMSVGGIHQVR